MIEREIKLHVPAGSLAEVESEMHRMGAAQAPMHACYFDTPQRDLARARIALRLRLEGDRWVQTIKAPGPDELSRLEINHDRPRAELDLSVYHGTGTGAFLSGLAGKLQLQYETRISRLSCRREFGGALIELACDRGLILSDGLALAVSELELELVSGDSAGLFRLAEQWLGRHRLIIDLRSKAERGDALASAARTGTPEPLGADSLISAPHAQTPMASPSDHPVDAWLSYASESLNQLIRGVSVLCGATGLAVSNEFRTRCLGELEVAARQLHESWRKLEPGANAAAQALEKNLQDHLRLLSLLPYAGVNEGGALGNTSLGVDPAPTGSANGDEDYRGLQTCLLKLLAHLTLVSDAR
jgi:hypothetical protein